MATAALAEGPSLGKLNFNASRISMLQSSLSGLSSDMGTVPDLIRTIIEGECWRAFKFPDSPVVRWNAADFRKFIEAKRPEGCESQLHVLERALRGSEIWEAYLDLVRGKPGAQPGDVRNPEGINRDIITVNQDPSIIPFDAPVPEPRARDYSREAPTGTSVTYALRRLKNQRPDLLEKVQAKEISPNAAMIEAGFKKPSITLPVDPESAVRLIVKHFKGESLESLIRGLANWSGYDIVERG